MSRDQLQLKELESQLGMAAPEVDVDAEHRPDVSRAASNASLRREAVQMRGGDATKDPASVHDAASRGVQGSGSKLPHYDRIQAAFGAHDISHVQAYTGGDAATASREIGAEAYARGDQIAFAESPDLHTAAHEAAHVVQQSQGVNLYGGVGQAGDAHEKNADAVADRVVRGESAADLLGPVSSGGGAASTAVQRKEMTEEEQKKAKHDQHDKAEQSSYEGFRGSLLVTAGKLRQAATNMNAAQKSYGDAGYEPAFQIIQREFDSAMDAAKHLSTVASHFDGYIQNQTRQTHMHEEFKAVWGSFIVFRDAVNRANNFTSAHKGGENMPSPINVNAFWVEQWLDGVSEKFGGNYKTTKKDANFHDGEKVDLKSSTNSALTEHLEGALEAAKEIETGTDSGIGRMRYHLQEAQQLTKDLGSDKSSLKKHKPEIHKVVVELKKLEKSHTIFKQTWAEFEPIVQQLEKLLK